MDKQGPQQGTPLGDRIAEAIGRWLGRKLVARRDPSILQAYDKVVFAQQAAAQPPVPVAAQLPAAPANAEPTPVAAEMPVAAETQPLRPIRPVSHETCDILLMLASDLAGTLTNSLQALAEGSVENVDDLLEDLHGTAASGISAIDQNIRYLEDGTAHEQRDAKTLAPLAQLLLDGYTSILCIHKPGQVKLNKLPSIDDIAERTAVAGMQDLISAARLSRVTDRVITTG